MQGFITIKEASELTGKHTDTIRRLVKNTNNSKLVTKDRKNRVLINTDWLMANFEPPEAPTSPDNIIDDKQSTQPISPAPDLVINALTNQLEAKDQQIAKLQALLSEKEGNTTKLQDQFQQLLARQQLPASIDDDQPPAYAEPMQTEVKQTKSKPKVKKAKPANARKKQGKTKAKPAPKQAKKSWWRRK